MKTSTFPIGPSTALHQAIEFYLGQKEKELLIRRGADSPYTIRDYRYHLQSFHFWILESRYPIPQEIQHLAHIKEDWIKQHQEKIPIGMVTTELIQDYLVSKNKEGISQATLSTWLYTLKSFFKLISASNFNFSDPVKEIKRQAPHYEKAPHLTLEHAHQLLDYLTQLDESNPILFRDKLLVWTLLKFGLRMSEGLGIGKADFHFTEHHLILTVRGKGNKNRTLPLPTVSEVQTREGKISYERIPQNQQYIDCLQRYLTESSGLMHFQNKASTPKKKSPKEKLGSPLPSTPSHRGKAVKHPLFLSSFGKTLSHDMVRIICLKMFSELGLTSYGYTPHSLRHTAVTNWLYSGVDLQTVSELAGHANISTTEKIYAHTEARKLSQGLAKSI